MKSPYEQSSKSKLHGSVKSFVLRNPPERKAATHASKAGLSNYLGGLALALKPKGVYVTNVRFGFINTKMAKGDVQPFKMSVETAVDHPERCIRKKPSRYTAPKISIPLVKFRKL